MPQHKRRILSQLYPTLCIFFWAQAADEDDTDTPPVERRICGVTVTTEWIPYILFAGDVITSLASGMTIKFFPLWVGVAYVSACVHVSKPVFGCSGHTCVTGKSLCFTALGSCICAAHMCGRGRTACLSM